mgnify:CR=1 FL=1
MGKLDQVVKALEEKLEFDEREFVARHIFRRTRDPFKVLIATIISQNTTDINTSRALRRLSEVCDITPTSIANTPLEKIREAIRPAGLQDGKAKAIKEAALMIVNEYDGDSLRALSGDVDEVRKRLMRIKGIGYKTVDVVLMNLGYPVLAIDTHIKRVAKRLGLASNTDSYLRIQRSLQEELEREDPLKTHLLLIKFGRVICRARRPKCNNCPLKDICQYYLSTQSSKA